MKRIALVLLMLLLASASAHGQTETIISSCWAYSWTVGETGTSNILPTNRKEAAISMSGDGTATATLEECPDAEDTATCKDLRWDTNGDGVNDTNTLDGVTDHQSSLQNVKIAGGVRITAATAPASGTAFVVVCLQ